MVPHESSIYLKANQIGHEAHGYIPHVKGRGQEAEDLRRHPFQRARRWVVEVAHSWFNRFRKLLVLYEILERSFLALHHRIQKGTSGKEYYLWVKFLAP